MEEVIAGGAYWNAAWDLVATAASDSLNIGEAAMIYKSHLSSLWIMNYSKTSPCEVVVVGSTALYEVVASVHRDLNSKLWNLAIYELSCLWYFSVTSYNHFIFTARIVAAAGEIETLPTPWPPAPSETADVQNHSSVVQVAQQEDDIQFLIQCTIYLYIARFSRDLALQPGDIILSIIALYEVRVYAKLNIPHQATSHDNLFYIDY